MTEESLTRRRLLVASAGVASAASLSGCSGLLGEGDDSESGGGTLAVVPSGSAEVLISLDVQRVLDDDLMHERIETVAGSGPGDTVGAPTSFDELLDSATSALGGDPREISELLAFGQLGEGTDAPPAAGVVVEADWSESELESTLVSERGRQKTSHNGQTVYEWEGDAVGVLPEGRYIAAPLRVVRDSIDVAVGDEPSLDNDAATAFRDAPDGYARMAFVPSSGTVAAAEEDGVDVIASLQQATGALYRDDGSRGGELTMEFDSGDAATQAKAVIETGRERFRTELAGQQLPEFGEQVAGVIEGTSVSRDGSSLRVENQSGDGWLLVIPMAVVGSFVLGFGAQGGQQPLPQAAFDFQWDADTETATITHASGDTLPADQLYVYGDVVNGSWLDLGGDTSGTHDGAPAVVAGDSLTLDAEPGARIDVVWEGSSGSATLATFTVRG